MKHSLRLFAALALALCGCQSDGWCTFAAELNQAGHAFAVSQLGPFAGSKPSRTDDYDACRDGRDPGGYGGPNIGSQAFEPLSPPVSICSSRPGTNQCAACILANCCAEMSACVDDYTCTCRLARQTPGIDWPEAAECPTDNDLATAAADCRIEHCEAECLP